MAASFLLLLTSVGLFLSAQAQDCSPPEAGANMVLKGTDILSASFPDGTKATFACEVGYETVAGSASVTCAAGSWSPLKMRCERKSCGAIGDVPNGAVDYSEGIDFGDKLTVTCDPGYDRVGKATILCGDKGWSDRLPVCEVMHCDPPAAPTIGSFNPVKDTYDYREVIQFSCPEAFTLNGSKSLACSETGLFQPAAPKCVKVDCKEPVVEFGHWDSGSRGPYTYKATITFKCHQKYMMTNSATIVCGINEQWEPELPKCELVTEVKTTNTERPESTKKPTAAAPGPTAPGPTAGAEGLSTGAAVCVAFAVIILVIAIAYGSWRYGFLKCPKKKSGSGKGHTVVPTEDEVELGKRDDAAVPQLQDVEPIR